LYTVIKRTRRYSKVKTFIAQHKHSSTLVVPQRRMWSEIVKLSDI